MTTKIKYVKTTRLYFKNFVHDTIQSNNEKEKYNIPQHKYLSLKQINVVLKRTVFFFLDKKKIRRNFLSSFSTDSPCQLDILGHDSDTLGMDSAQVGIFKKTN